MRRLPLSCLLFCFAQSARAEDTDEPIVVRGKKASGAETSFSVSGAEASRRAGSLGDATRVIESAPGFARGGPSGEIVAWGSNEEESSILVDGVPIPFLFHGGVIRGVLPSEEIASLRLVPGAFAAEWGRATGGLVLLGTSELPRTNGFRLHADALDVGGALRASDGDGLRGEIAFRQGVLRALLTEAGVDLTQSPYLVPDYRDWQARVVVDLSPRERIHFSYLGAEDTSERASLSSRTGTTTDAHFRSFSRIYANYERETSEGKTTIVPFVGTNEDRRDVDSSATGYAQSRNEWVVGVRASRSFPMGARAHWTLGFDLLDTSASHSRLGTLSLPKREGDPHAFGILPASDVASDGYATNVLEAAPHVSASLRFGPFDFSPGIRLAAGFTEVSAVRPTADGAPKNGLTKSFVAPEPRLALRYAQSRNFAIFGSLGLYSRAPSSSDLSPVFGTPSLAPSSASHSVLGTSAQWGSIEVQFSGFFKSLWGIAARTTSPSPRVAAVLDGVGEGEVIGTQTLLRLRRWQGWSGWVSWTISQSLRRDAPGLAMRAMDFDQPHVVALVLEKEIERWVPSVRVRYASGAPRTPIVAAASNLGSGDFEPIWGERNSVRLPAFVSVDLRVERALDLEGFGELKIAVEALNLTARENVEEFVYPDDFSKRGEILGLPPLLNLAVEFRR